VELGEIERAMLGLAAVKEATVVPREHPNGGISLAAYLVPAGPAPDASALRSTLASRLPGYMLPSTFTMVDHLPITTSGKVDWSQLADQPTLGATRVHCAPRTSTESRLAELWCQVLRLPSVGVHDNFFQLGGDSLLATRLAVQIHELFSIELPLARMLTDPTIEAVAGYLDSAASRADHLPEQIVPLREGVGGRPPLFLAPPASGSPACYAIWAAAFRRGRAVYGLSSPGLSSGHAVVSIRDQARIYVEAIRAVQPAGPYYVAGWSLGAAVAFEIACQLREAGERVAYLGLIDGALPERGRLPGNISLLRGLWWAVVYPFSERLPLNYATVRQLANFLGVALPTPLFDLRQRGFTASVRLLTDVVFSAARSLRVFMANIRGLRSYQPRRFDGAVTLFCTKPPKTVLEDVLQQRLSKWCDRLDVKAAPGTHMTLILDPQLATQFAPLFENTLEPQLEPVIVDRSK
jgi:thioesterase domain-containing protein/acyl carrier protein